MAQSGQEHFHPNATSGYDTRALDALDLEEGPYADEVEGGLEDQESGENADEQPEDPGDSVESTGDIYMPLVTQ